MPTVDKAEADREAQTEHEMIIHDVEAQYQRLSNVAFPMFERNVELCGTRTRPSLEGIWINKYVGGKDFMETMSRAGYGETPTLVAAGAGSALTMAGVMPGDMLTAIDGWPVPPGEDSIKETNKKLDELLKQKSTVRLSLTTKNGARDVDVTPHRICAFNFAIIYSDIVNAGSDGENIVLTTGFVRFAQNDIELATVFGHEMAHNVMQHSEKMKSERLWGGLLDVFTGGISGLIRGRRPGSSTPALESEADYVGLYLMARTGYPVDGAANIWRRMALAEPASTNMKLASDHPPTPERYVLIEKTAAEIDGKVRNGQPLLPEMAK